MIKPPCKDKTGTDCPDRAVGCQGRCEKYLAFRAAKDEELRKEALSREGALYAADNAFRIRNRLLKTSPGQRRLLGQR